MVTDRSSGIPFFGLALIAIAGCAVAIRGESGALISGPMLGYSEHREVLVWIEVENAKSVSITYWPDDQPDVISTIEIEAPPPHPAGGSIVKFRPGLLDPGTAYHYSLSIDSEPLEFPYPLRFKTRALWEWRGGPPNLSFLTGSCAYLNEAVYDRPGTPYGKGTEIFRHMADSGADFMVWLGDTLYLREVDWSSESGIWYRFQHDRRTPDLRRLFAIMPHWAIWDDHDYGPDNSNRGFEMKETTLAAFNAYWGNPTAGEPDNPGIYTKFFRGDAAFILLDNRYYRDDSRLDQVLHPEKTMYGARQIDWLKQSLLQAQQPPHYNFKFIVTGSRFLQTHTTGGESANEFQRERQDIIDFIRDQAVTGVVFLTGDIHTTVLQRHDLPGMYPLFELTSSPLSSGVSQSRLPGIMSDPNRIEGTVVGDQNYCRIDVAGPPEDRSLTLQCYDKTNTLRWTHALKAKELMLSTQR
jgi:alkaline phosphatase D